MVEALQRGPRLTLGQAGRSELQRSDLRQPLRRRRRRDLHADLVPQPQVQRRLSWPGSTPRSSSGALNYRVVSYERAPASGRLFSRRASDWDLGFSNSLLPRCQCRGSTPWRFVRLAHTFRNYQKPETGFRRHLPANLVLPHDWARPAKHPFLQLESVGGDAFSIRRLCSQSAVLSMRS